VTAYIINDINVIKKNGNIFQGLYIEDPANIHNQQLFSSKKYQDIFKILKNAI